MFHMLRSVTLRIGGRGRDLEDAVLLVDLGGRNGDAGIEMADDEFHAVADELVGDRNAFLGIGAVVADVESWIFWPRMPPAALMSSTACSTPFLSWAPNAALPPVIGPATPSLTCAEAASAKARPRPKATPSESHCLHKCPPLHENGEAYLSVAQERLMIRNSSPKWMEMSSEFWPLRGCRFVAATPAKRARPLVDPSIAGDHLGHPHQAEAEQSERQQTA